MHTVPMPMPNDLFDQGFYKELLDHMSDGVYFVDRDRKIIYWNDGAAKLTSYKAEEVVGRHCQDNILCHVDPAGHNLCQNGCPLSATVKDGEGHNADVFLRHKQGWRVPVNVRVEPLRDKEGSIVGAIEIFSDNTAQQEERRRTDAMQRLAFLDALTQLPNRRYVEMALNTALNEYKVHNDPFGVMMIDLDGFKGVNDTLGHTNGDRVLQKVARTLSGSLRSADVLGRWGGDEFVAIVQNVNEEALRVMANRCTVLVQRSSFAEEIGPTHRNALELSAAVKSISVSVGGTMVRPTDTPEDLILRADQLMYQSKMAVRNRATVG
jgi:diguanylate cyclase (GGDEF)-like protein/PAS domain S-box-containing protein